MSSPTRTDADARIARSLGLKPDVLAALRGGLEAGEHPLWLRCGEPALAGLFPDALGFDLLLEKLRRLEAFERRRANALREHAGEDLQAWRERLAQAETEGEFEDLLLKVQPSPPPAGVEAPAREGLANFLVRLRGDEELAAALRKLFEARATLTVSAVGEGEEAKRHHEMAGGPHPLTGMDPAVYLRLRRGEKARFLKMSFELPRPEVLALFGTHGKDAPAQEKEVYRETFVRFVDEERVPRLVQDFRAAMKHRAEMLALQEAWAGVAHALDRGHQDGAVLGVAPGRGAKVVLALIEDRDVAPRTLEVEAKGDGFEAALDEFLGEVEPVAVAFSGEGIARPGGQRAVKHLRKKRDQLRSVLVPPGIGRTLQREVARRPSEALLAQDERQAFLIGWLALDPRAVALHTPRIIRAFVPLRAEVNPRLLDEFEGLFVRELLIARGVDVNVAGLDALRRVPGVDPEAVAAERSTAPFRSLEDFQARMEPNPREARTAYCLLRVRGGDDPLDGARFVHPALRPAFRRTLAAAGAALEDVARDPARFDALPWAEALKDEPHGPGLRDRIREAMARGARRRPSLRRHAEVRRLETMQRGDRLKGVVKSLAEYGAFVDVGASRPGLLHVSHLAADRFVKDPSEVVQVGQEVEVRVLSVDLAEQRMRLSLLTEEQEAQVAQRLTERRAERDGGERGGGRGGRGERREGAPAGGRGARGDRPQRGDRDERGPRRERRRNEDFGPDPRARREEIDPTNPFFQFFNQNKPGK